MNNFIIIEDARNEKWIIDIDKIICVEEYNGSNCKSIIHIPNFNIWMKETIEEVFNMFKKEKGK